MVTCNNSSISFPKEMNVYTCIYMYVMYNVHVHRGGLCH